MTLEIYWGSGSPHSWRVLLAAEILRLPYESRLLEFSKAQHRTPEYLALNPRGKVPVMRDGDVVLYESLAILGYFDRLTSGALYGKTPAEAGRTQRIISEFECYVREPLSKVTSHLLFVGGAPSTPRTPTLEQAIAANAILRDELTALSALAERGHWLAGEHVSAADVAIYPFVRLFLRAGWKAEPRAKELGVFPFGETFAGLDRWMARVEQLPGYERTFPPHWRAS